MLDRDPSYQDRMAEQERQRQRLVADHRDAAEPIVAELRSTGFEIEEIGDLRSVIRSAREYAVALPVLTSWLPCVAHAGVKAEIVGMLGSKWAGDAVPVLVSEFLATPVDRESTLKWAMGNALAEAADRRAFDDLVALVCDQTHGRAREMLPLALARTGNPAAVNVLVALLDDDQVAGHAIIALGRMRAMSARSAISRFVDHPIAWVRREARRTLAKLDRIAALSV